MDINTRFLKTSLVFRDTIIPDSGITFYFNKENNLNYLLTQPINSIGYKNYHDFWTINSRSIVGEVIVFSNDKFTSSGEVTFKVGVAANTALPVDIIWGGKNNIQEPLDIPSVNNGIICYSNDQVMYENYLAVTIEKQFLSVAVGDTSSGSLVMYSYNGKDWYNITIDLNSGHGVAFNGKQWILLGEGGTYNVFYSNDGINWLGSESGTNLLNTYGNGAAYDGNKWVAVGEGVYNIIYSYNGIDWLPTNANPVFNTNAYGIATNGKRWVAVGNGVYNIGYSEDGINWVGSPSGSSLINNQGWAVAWNGEMWIAVGEGVATMIYSYDGISWNVVNSIASLQTGTYSIAWNGKIWIAGGEGSYNIIYSYNGLNWQGTVSNPSITTIYGIAWNGTVWIATGQGGIEYSTDGINWSFSPSGSTGPNSPGWGVCSRLVKETYILDSPKTIINGTLDVTVKLYPKFGF